MENVDITPMLFWRGPLSNWAQCEFSVGNFRYGCTEQYIMHQKAILFGDESAAQAVMLTASPREHKALGRKVQNFNQSVWNERAKYIAFLGNIAKFTQSPVHMAILMDTGSRVLAEASPMDKIWGIGLAEDDPRALDPKQWQGENWHGQVLMSVRKCICRGQGVSNVW